MSPWARPNAWEETDVEQSCRFYNPKLPVLKPSCWSSKWDGAFEKHVVAQSAWRDCTGMARLCKTMTVPWETSSFAHKWNGQEKKQKQDTVRWKRKSEREKAPFWIYLCIFESILWAPVICHSWVKQWHGICVFIMPPQVVGASQTSLVSRFFHTKYK